MGNCNVQTTTIPSPRWGTDCVPGMILAHGPLAQVHHNVELHLGNVLFQVLVVLRVLRLFPLIVPDPDADNSRRDGNGEEKVNPELVRDDRAGAFALQVSVFIPGGRVSSKRKKLTGLKVEKRHAKYGREKRAREEECAEQGDCLHSRAVALAGVGDAALLSGDFEVETGFALRHDVVQLQDPLAIASMYHLPGQCSIPLLVAPLVAAGSCECNSPSP
jgi:hypothetical protein